MLTRKVQDGVRLGVLFPFRCFDTAAPFDVIKSTSKADSREV